MDIPSVLKWKIARITNMASTSTQKADGTSSAHGSLGTPRLGGSSQATSRHLGTKVTSGLPHRLRLMGGSSRSLRTQSPPPSNLDSFMRWVALATLLLVV